MRPLEVRPVKPTYNPGYPSFLKVDDWEELVRLSSRRTFDPATLLFAGILGSTFLVSAATSAGVDPKREAAPKMETPIKSANAKAAEIASKALGEAKDKAGWYPRSSISQREVVKGNPQVTVPHIPISFGNSYVGVFDTRRAKQVTLELFAAYGVKLQADQPFSKNGVQFQVDGYDPDKKIGFEIVLPEKPVGFGRRPPVVASTPAETLDEKEAKALGELVTAKKETLFLAPATLYPNMDGDQYTPLRSYLQSVLDYLEWLKQQGRL